jgi:sialic acid synthase SpsE
MKNNEIIIAGRKVGYQHRPLIIAEIGINHGGNLDIAKQMVYAAITAGAEVIKHQTHIVEDEMSQSAKATIPGNADKSIYDIMEECALDKDQEFELMQYTQRQGAIFISTPFSRAAANRLAEFDVPAFKIGSGECNNYPLIEHIARMGKPVILSTGMNTLESVAKAVEIFRTYSVPYALLHTTNLYPTPNHLVRLGAMTDLAAHFSDAVVGLSDHTISNHASFAAVALGGAIIERHFTDSMSRPGPDIICSMDPSALQELQIGCEIIQLQRGGNKSSSLQEEQVTRDFAYATVVSIKSIAVGDVFDESNIWVKRPGTGQISADEFKGLLGKTCKRNIEADQHLCWEDIV